MNWQSLAMKSTEFNRPGKGLGDALASSDRMDDRMWSTQVRQPSRKASSTAGESVKRLKGVPEEHSAGPEDTEEVETESGEPNSNTLNISFNSQSPSTYFCHYLSYKIQYVLLFPFSSYKSAALVDFYCF